MLHPPFKVASVRRPFTTVAISVACVIELERWVIKSLKYEEDITKFQFEDINKLKRDIVI